MVVSSINWTWYLYYRLSKSEKKHHFYNVKKGELKMLEVAYIIVAIALVVFLVYLIITLQKVGRVIDETEKNC